MITFLARLQDRAQDREVAGGQGESTDKGYVAKEYGPWYVLQQNLSLFSFKERRIVLSLRFWVTLEAGWKTDLKEGGREDTEVRETSRSLVRDHEAVDVSSAIFFLEGATIYIPNSLPIHCPT